MSKLQIKIKLQHDHFLITRLSVNFLTEDRDLIHYLNSDSSSLAWLDPSLSEISPYLLQLLSALRRPEIGIIQRTPPFSFTLSLPSPSELLYLLLDMHASWEIQDKNSFIPKFKKEFYSPTMKIDFLSKKLMLKNSNAAFLFPSLTTNFIVKKTEIMKLNPIFDSNSMIELFKNGIIDAPAEWLEKLPHISEKHPIRKWLFIPKIQKAEEDLKITFKIKKTSKGFLLEVGLSSPQQNKKNFIPIDFPKNRQAMLMNEAFILHNQQQLLFISPEEKLYQKIRFLITEVYQHFFEFLGEIDENRIYTKDQEGLFHRFLPLFGSELLILDEKGQNIEFRQLEQGSMQLDLHNPEDLENKKIDWLEVDFKYKIDDIELNLKQIQDILNQGYTVLNQKWITLKTQEIKNLSKLFEKIKIQSRKEKNFVHRYRISSIKSFDPKSSLALLQKSLAKKTLIEPINIPKEIDKQLRSYQKFGIGWLQFLNRFGFGGILADEMGLGKTLQILTFLASQEKNYTALIICPSSLIYNWSAEIEKFFGNQIPYLIIDGPKNSRIEKINQMKHYRILITSYNMAHLDKEAYQTHIPDYCIIDEAQHIKNKAAKRTQSIKDIPAHTRIAITGTPIENNLSELWSIFDFLMPGFLGTHKEFKEQFENAINGFNRKTAKETLKKLKERVSPFILRRTKAKVIHELPPKTEQIIRLELSEKQKSLYLETLEKVRSNTLDAIQSKGIQKSYMDFLAALTRLRQVCLHTGLLLPEQENSESDSIKLKALIELIEEAMDSHHRVLVFSQFVQMLKLIRQEFHRQKIEYLYLDGHTRNRVALVNQFNESNIPVFLISLRAGGVGLNLTGADAVILFDPWWNPSVENQAIDRVHRIGQHNPVHVYRLITQGTIEDKIHILQKQKQGISDSILSTEDHFIRNLTIQDIQELLSEGVKDEKPI